MAEGLASAIDPITYAEARALMDEHRRLGRQVYLVSAAPAEIVEPLAEHQGAHEALASVARVDRNGRYTGDLERYAYGAEKAALIRHLAARDGLDLAGSWAYSDSATDLPMLEAVGHPVAVNPDRALRRIAQLRGWQVLRFDRTLLPTRRFGETAAGGVPEATLAVVGGGRERMSWALWGSAAVAVLAAGSAGAVAWSYGSLSWRAASELRTLRDL